MKLLIPPPVVALLAGFIMWILAGQVGWLVAFSGQLMLACLAVACGVMIDLSALIAFRKARTTINPLSPDKTVTLVSTGVFRFTRNPMYLGLVFILAGWLIWLGQPLNIPVLFALIAYLTQFQIKPEEAVLVEKFGDTYLAYQRRVRRWI